MCFSLNLLQHLTLLVSEVTTFRGEGGGELLLSYTYRAWYVTLAKDMKYTM